MSDSTINKMVADYAANIKNKEVSTMTFIEEFIEISPIIEDKVDSVYYLYEVTYTDQTTDKYVYIVNDSSQMVILGTPEVINDIFSPSR